MNTLIVAEPPIPSSQELSEVAYTVPSDSEHQFLVEAIESHYHAEVAKTQLIAHTNRSRLKKLFEEQRQKSTKLEELNYLEVAVGRKDDEIVAEKELTLKRLSLDRDDALKALMKWEESK